MSEDDKTRIIEDAPRYQSVAIHSSSAVPVPRTSPFAVAKVAPKGMSVRHPANVKEAQAWKITHLMPLPFYHPIERTNVYIADVPAQGIADRITESLRRESVACSVQQNEAVLRGETRCNVSFAVRLWSDKGMVLVEVQRISGCSFVFQMVAKCILRAAKGNPQSLLPKQHFTLPDCIPKQSEEERSSCMKEATEIACSMLQEDRLDAHRLAVESLVQVTKIAKCRKFVLEHMLKGEVFSTLLSLIETSSAEQASRHALSDMEDEHFSILHRNALIVLANCLGTVDQFGHLKDAVSQVDDLRSPMLMKSLIHDIANAEKRPYDACEAAKCLYYITSVSSEAKLEAIDLGAPKAIESAYQTGLSRHAVLEGLSDKLRVQFEDYL